MNDLDRIRGTILDQLGDASILEPELPHPPRHGVWLESLAETPAQWHNQTKLFVKDLQRVLVICLDSIGDTVMLGPALRALRTTLPQASIASTAKRCMTELPVEVDTSSNGNAAPPVLISDCPNVKSE